MQVSSLVCYVVKVEVIFVENNLQNFECPFGRLKFLMQLSAKRANLGGAIIYLT